MSEKQNQIADVESLKARITELEAENEKLKATMTEATKTLTAYVERERETAIKSILEKTTLSKDELEKLDLTQLRLIEKGVDNIKGTVKNVRSAGTAQSETENQLTVGCLYHKERV